MTREFKPAEFHACAQNRSFTQKWTCYTRKTVAATCPATCFLIEKPSCYHQLTATFLARKIAQSVITLRQFLYTLRTSLILWLKDGCLTVWEVSTKLLEIDVGRCVFVLQTRWYSLILSSRADTLVHLKIIHSYTRYHLKIWKDKILKSIITWYQMGKQTAQSKKVCLKLSENK